MLIMEAEMKYNSTETQNIYEIYILLLLRTVDHGRTFFWRTSNSAE